MIDRRFLVAWLFLGSQAQALESDVFRGLPIDAALIADWEWIAKFDYDQSQKEMKLAKQGKLSDAECKALSDSYAKSTSARFGDVDRFTKVLSTRLAVVKWAGLLSIDELGKTRSSEVKTQYQEVQTLAKQNEVYLVEWKSKRAKREALLKEARESYAESTDPEVRQQYAMLISGHEKALQEIDSTIKKLEEAVIRAQKDAEATSQDAEPKIDWNQAALKELGSQENLDFVRNLVKRTPPRGDYEQSVSPQLVELTAKAAAIRAQMTVRCDGEHLKR